MRLRQWWGIGASLVAACSEQSTAREVPRGPGGARLAVSAPGEPLPDLTVTPESLRPRLEVQDFAPNDCAVAEACVGGPGARQLLKFTTRTPNIGSGDLVLGDPAGNPQFEFSACHAHYHFQNYALYELIDETGATVVTGRKQGFCLLDYEPLPGTDTPPRYDCPYQGISAGWADVYDDTTDCNWLDVTGLPSGSYTLRVTVNPDRMFEESSYDNNVATAPVTLP